jgi:hypothetical protein
LLVCCCAVLVFMYTIIRYAIRLTWDARRMHNGCTPEQMGCNGADDSLN